MTYMHAPFIKEAMDGIMMQETDFKVEVVVGDDFSKDGTLDIIRTYSDTDNIHIKILKREKGDAYWQKRQELGRLHNFINILENCSGKYIALLDGDDYWMDPLKLQKQVDFLRSNAEYSIHSGQIKTYYQNSNKFKTSKLINSYSVRVKDLLSKSHLKTCTLLYRNLKIDYPDLMFKEKGADRQLQMLLLQDGGKAFISDETYAVYRKHDGGLTSTLNKNLFQERFNSSFAQVRIAKDWNRYLDLNEKKIVRKNKFKQFKRMVLYFKEAYNLKYIYGALKILFY